MNEVFLQGNTRAQFSKAQTERIDTALLSYARRYSKILEEEK